MIELKPVLDAIEALTLKLDKFKREKELQARGCSDLKELYTALSKAQNEFNIAALNKSNPYFKSSYADMMSVVQASRPALSKYGLAVTQQILKNDDGQLILHTILTHSSGQYIETQMPITPSKNDIQSINSYITYIKRITYTSLVGVVTGEDDDDGEAAVSTERETYAKGVALNTKYNPREQVSETISKDQLDILEQELAEYPDIASQVLEGLKLMSLADMPKSKFAAALNRVRDIKNMRNGVK